MGSSGGNKPPDFAPLIQATLVESKDRDKNSPADLNGNSVRVLQHNRDEADMDRRQNRIDRSKMTRSRISSVAVGGILISQLACLETLLVLRSFSLKCSPARTGAYLGGCEASEQDGMHSMTAS
jgi:hypothetical protein